MQFFKTKCGAYGYQLARWAGPKWKQTKVLSRQLARTTLHRLGVPDPDAKFIRLGWLGPTSGGKTCLLVGMAVAHRHTPDLFIKEHVIDRRSADPDLIRGHDELKVAVSKIMQGNLPETTDKLTMRIRYELTQPSGKSMLEFIEYPGEILELDVAQMDQSLLFRMLEKYLLSVDILMVTAEVAPKNASQTELAVHRTKLKKIHNILSVINNRRNLKDRRASRLPRVPMVLMVDKWDRNQTPMLDHAAEQAALEAYLADPANSNHKDIGVEMLANAGGDPAFYKAFPVSAFGPSVSSSGQEIPAQVNPLQSFGLEEPLAWALQARQAWDVADLSKPMRPKEFLFNFPKTDRHARLLARSLEKLPVNSADRPVLMQQAAKVKKLRLAQNWLAAAFLLLVFLLLEAGIDAASHAGARQKLTTASTAPSERGPARDWYTSYITSRWYRHLFYKPRTTIIEEYGRIEGERLDTLWKNLLGTKSREDRIRRLNQLQAEDPKGLILQNLGSVATMVELTNPENPQPIKAVKLLVSLKPRIKAAEYETLVDSFRESFWGTATSYFQDVELANWKDKESELDELIREASSSYWEFFPDKRIPEASTFQTMKSGLREKGFRLEWRELGATPSKQQLDEFWALFGNEAVWESKFGEAMKALKNRLAWWNLCLKPITCRVRLEELQWGPKAAENTGFQPAYTLTVGSNAPLTNECSGINGRKDRWPLEYGNLPGHSVEITNYSFGNAIPVHCKAWEIDAGFDPNDEWGHCDASLTPGDEPSKVVKELTGGHPDEGEIRAVLMVEILADDKWMPFEMTKLPSL